MNVEEIIVGMGYGSVEKYLYVWQRDREIVRKALEVDCSAKQEMLRVLTRCKACISGICWAVLNADTLEQLWDALVEHKQGMWLYWLAWRTTHLMSVKGAHTIVKGVCVSSCNYEAVFEALYAVPNPWRKDVRN